MLVIAGKSSASLMELGLVRIAAPVALRVRLAIDAIISFR